MIEASYGSVCATPLSFDHAGMNRIMATNTGGTRTPSERNFRVGGCG